MRDKKSIWYNEVLKNSARLAISLQGKDEGRVWPITSTFVIGMMMVDPEYFDSQYSFEDIGDYFLLTEKS